MFKINLKIALRNLRRNLSLSLINVGGLSVAIAAFILIVLYVNYETSYDKYNANYKNIYLVGRELGDLKSDFTAPALAQMIEQHCPEVELVGLMTSTSFDFAIISDRGRVYVKDVLLADLNAANIFDLQPAQGLKKPAGNSERLFYLKPEQMQVLFPGKKDLKPELVMMGNKTSGLTGSVEGAINANPHSNIRFDALAISEHLGLNEGFGKPNYRTYIQVKPGVNIEVLQSKIDRLLEEGLKQAYKEADAQGYAKENVYLDPLSNLHLRPHAGNDTNYKVVVALLILSVFIVVIACINFTNLSIAQANRRAKEVGVKKVLGAYRHTLTLQFIPEIFVQCVLALVLALILSELLLPSFNNLFEVPLSLGAGAADLSWMLPTMLVLITAIAGVYPAMILSGFRPALVLKGNFQTSMGTQWLRKGLLIFQFAIAVLFIAGILIVSKQVAYMHTEDTGLQPNQVLVVKNQAIFDKPEVFAPLRDKILKIDGVKSVTVANNVPGGSNPGGNSYSVAGKKSMLDFVDVDFDYFETLGIKLKAGRGFSREFQSDTLNAAVINERAAAKFGLADPVGKTIRGCETDYKIIGLIKDVKAQGFESAVQPTIYTMNNPCGNPKLNILIKVDGAKMHYALEELNKQWSIINKLDGETFRYDFLDELFGRLFKKQEQLKSVFFAAAMLTIFIALLGLFAFAKIMTGSRSKEIAVRKVLGASDLQVLKLLNTSFLWMLLIANVIAWPFVYILAKTWLNTFAYRTDLSVIPFATAAIISIFLAVITVSLQAARTVHANPSDVLKND